DVCWMIALFAAALWLAEEGSFVAGIAAGLSLYTYLGARIAVVSLLVFLALECTVRRDRTAYRRAAEFVTGVALAAAPFFLYYVSQPGAFWARTAQVSLVSSPKPVRTIPTNLPHHSV